MMIYDMYLILFNIIKCVLVRLNCHIDIMGTPVAGFHLENVRLRRQLPRQRKHTVGVYFGTFDPIHENHVGLAKFAPGCLAKPEEVPDVC